MSRKVLPLLWDFSRSWISFNIVLNSVRFNHWSYLASLHRALLVQSSSSSIRFTCVSPSDTLARAGCLWLRRPRYRARIRDHLSLCSLFIKMNYYSQQENPYLYRAADSLPWSRHCLQWTPPSQCPSCPAGKVAKIQNQWGRSANARLRLHTAASFLKQLAIQYYWAWCLSVQLPRNGFLV